MLERKLRSELLSPGSAATSVVNSKTDFFNFVSDIPENSNYKLFVSEKLE